MTTKERVNALKNDIPKMKKKIINRSMNAVEGQNYVYVSADLTISIVDSNSHYFREPLITFPSGTFGEKIFQRILNEAIEMESRLM